MEKGQQPEHIAKGHLEKNTVTAAIKTGSSVPSFGIPHLMPISSQHNLYLLLVQTSISMHKPSSLCAGLLKDPPTGTVFGLLWDTVRGALWIH